MPAVKWCVRYVARNRSVKWIYLQRNLIINNWNISVNLLAVKMMCIVCVRSRWLSDDDELIFFLAACVCVSVTMRFIWKISSYLSMWQRQQWIDTLLAAASLWRARWCVVSAVDASQTQEFSFSLIIFLPRIVDKQNEIQILELTEPPQLK